MGRRSIVNNSIKGLYNHDIKGFNHYFYRWARTQLPFQYWLPVYGYGADVIDWRIFSVTIEEDFRHAGGFFENHTVVRYSEPLFFYEDRRIILELLEWVQKSIFEKLFEINRKTLKVLLMIATNKIMNSRLDTLYQSEMIEHMHACANVRFAVCEKYQYEYLLDLPF